VGITQERLALDAGVDRSFVSQIERGVRQPSLTTIWKLATALDVAPSLLLQQVEKGLAST
jgi:transcriptional regulator with XRE-family HTH domain